MKKDPVKKMLDQHHALIHSTMKKVTSHVQRELSGEWLLNTILIDGCDVPFKYKRQKKYKSLVGAYVDLVYYATTEKIAGMDIDYMKVVKIHIS